MLCKNRISHVICKLRCSAATGAAMNSRSAAATATLFCKPYAAEFCKPYAAKGSWHEQSMIGFLPWQKHTIGRCFAPFPWNHARRRLVSRAPWNNALLLIVATAERPLTTVSMAVCLRRMHVQQIRKAANVFRSTTIHRQYLPLHLNTFDHVKC